MTDDEHPCAHTVGGYVISAAYDCGYVVVSVHEPDETLVDAYPVECREARRLAVMLDEAADGHDPDDAIDTLCDGERLGVKLLSVVGSAVILGVEHVEGEPWRTSWALDGEQCKRLAMILDAAAGAIL